MRGVRDRFKRICIWANKLVTFGVNCTQQPHNFVSSAAAGAAAAAAAAAADVETATLNDFEEAVATAAPQLRGIAIGIVMVMPSGAVHLFEDNFPAFSSAANIAQLSQLMGIIRPRGAAGGAAQRPRKLAQPAGGNDDDAPDSGGGSLESREE